jgi:hypothetical protein
VRHKNRPRLFIHSSAALTRARVSGEKKKKKEKKAGDRRGPIKDDAYSVACRNRRRRPKKK